MINYLFGMLDRALRISEFVQNKKARKSNVLSKIRSALRETKKHVEDTRVGDYGDKESKDLAKKWSEAAEAIRPFNSRVAMTFEEKSDYWTNPSGYTFEIQNQQRRFDFLFRIHEVEKTLMELEQRWK